MTMYLQEGSQNSMLILVFHTIDNKHLIHYECQQRLSWLDQKAKNRSFERSKTFRSCRFCNGVHWIDECTRYQTMKQDSRRLEEAVLLA